MSVDDKCLIKIFKDFNGEMQNELTVTCGQIVQFVRRLDRIWFEVFQDGQTGNVPISICREMNYSELETLRIVKSSQAVFVSKFDFLENCQDNDLRFAHSEILIGFNQYDDQWWYGTRLSSVYKKYNNLYVDKSNCGIFPLNFVWKLREDLLSEIIFSETGIVIDGGQAETQSSVTEPLTVTIPSSTPTESVKFHVKVTQTMDAQLDTEIDLKQIGEILAVIRVPDKMFYYGKSLDGQRRGIFPKKFVEIIADAEVRSQMADNSSSQLSCGNSDSSVSPAPPTISPPPAPELSPFPTSPPIFQSQSSIDDDRPPSYDAAMECERITNGYSNYMLKEVRPYGQVLYDFVPELPTDLALAKDEIVYLIRHVDSNWMEGEINGRIGNFPKNFVSIIVDCEPANENNIEKVDVNSALDNTQNSAREFAPNSYAKILFDYNGEYKDDLKVTAGETVTLIRYFESDGWMEAKQISGTIGFLHANLCEPINCTIPPSEQIAYPSLDSSLPTVKEDEKLTEKDKTLEMKAEQTSDLKPNRPAPTAPRNQNAFRTFNQFLYEEKADLYQFDNDSNAGSRPSNNTSEKPPQDQSNINKNQRQCVITELIQTERDYCDAMNIFVNTFEAKNLEAKQCGVDISKLFGEIKSIISVSKHLIKSLENYAYCKPFDEQRIGICFIDLKFEIKDAYTKYCRGHDAVNLQLKQYEDDPRSSDFILSCLAKIQSKTNCFDLSSILIKPVQRILKYPLLLNELIKYTDENHVDYDGLQRGLQIITHIATTINEHKRRQDLILKYCKTDNSLSNRLKNLNMHSVMKKGSRMSYRIFSTFKFSSGTKDKTYDDILHRFQSVEKTIKTFVKNLSSYLENLNNYFIQLLIIIESIGEFYDVAHTPNRDLEYTKHAHRKISTEYYCDFRSSIENDVIKVLHKLQNKFAAPIKLIGKRDDKRIDYEKSLRSKADTNEAKNNFEALNQQLIDDLPILTEASMQILKNCVHKFLHEYHKLYYKTRDSIMYLKSLTLVQNVPFEYPQDIEEAFRVRHNLIFERMLNEFSLIHANLFAEVSSDGTSTISNIFKNKNTWKNSMPIAKTTTTSNTNPEATNSTEKKLQDDSQKVYIKCKYKHEDVFTVTSNYESFDVMELFAQIGDLVGVIKQRDPMGQEHRWYVDRGCDKGFLPRSILVPYYEPEQQQHHAKTIQPTMSNQSHLYDLVPDDLSLDSQHSSLLSFEEVDCKLSDSKYGIAAEFDPLVPTTSRSDNSSIECYQAAYPFKAGDPNQLSLDFGQIVSVLHKCDTSGNHDWWCVKNAAGKIGYVPGNYLRKQ